MKYLIKHLLLFIYNTIYRRHMVTFFWSSYFSHRCSFEGRNFVGRRANFFGSLGYGTYVGDESLMSAEVGRFCSIGSRCHYVNTRHAFKEPFVSTSPLFFSAVSNTFAGKNSFADRQMFDEYTYYDKERQIVNKIGNDVWIGLDVRLVGGVTIGDGAVVLTQAFVTKDVPPYAIVGGIPAKIIGYRYDQETIDFLLRTKWWENDERWFKENWELLCDMNKLKEYYKVVL